MFLPWNVWVTDVFFKFSRVLGKFLSHKLWNSSEAIHAPNVTNAESTLKTGRARTQPLTFLASVHLLNFYTRSRPKSSRRVLSLHSKWKIHGQLRDHRGDEEVEQEGKYPLVRGGAFYVIGDLVFAKVHKIRISTRKKTISQYQQDSVIVPQHQQSKLQGNVHKEEHHDKDKRGSHRPEDKAEHFRISKCLSLNRLFARRTATRD